MVLKDHFPFLISNFSWVIGTLVVRFLLSGTARSEGEFNLQVQQVTSFSLLWGEATETVQLHFQIEFAEH
jgi:hypothetical protein